MTSNTSPERHWYKEAVIYEVHVRAFQDSNGDGIGDFPGLTQRLDYLQDLGITAIWLLPFYPSPLKDDGYDISRYTEIHPHYGTLDDFKVFMDEAHRRGLKVITELVLNHTSDQHEWFQKSRRAEPGSRWREFYVWSETPQRYEDARIIFKDFESSNWSWDPLAKAYYWHRFYSHQPDLNWDNPEVEKTMFEVVDFWLRLGVDGLRLDAVPYLIEREGTSSENLPETHDKLKALRRHIDERFKDRMLLAEANQWPDDSAVYFGSGDECQMCFHFPLMPRLFMAIAHEDRFAIVDILEQTPAIPDNCQWALFLRNHDELTLEMVTDEDRDYMYRTFAKEPQARINLGIRRRLAPLLGNDRPTIKLMNGLLLSFPGTPVIYYGDEINMGDNIFLGDRNGVRTPMQWSADRNAGFSRSNPQRLYLPVIIDPEYHYEAQNVDLQHNNVNSMLWWMKRMLALRAEFAAFGRGTFTMLAPSNRKVLAYLRRFENETVLVLANLSRFPQACELDLSAFAGRIPVELVGRSEFPAITDKPYVFSFGARTFFWFSLSERPGFEESAKAPVVVMPRLSRADWQHEGKTSEPLLAALASYLSTRRWFLGKAKRLRNLSVFDWFRVPDSETALVLLSVEYADQSSEVYVLPLSIAFGEEAEAVQKDPAQTVIAALEDGGVLYEALRDRRLWTTLFASMHGQAWRGRGGKMIGCSLTEIDTASVDVRPLTSDQSNTALVANERWFIKLIRKSEPGPHPEVEIGRALNDSAHAARLVAWFEYQRAGDDSYTLATVQEFVAQAEDGWRFTLDALGRFFENTLSAPSTVESHEPMYSVASPSESERVLVGIYLEHAARIGQRTAQMHRTLATVDEPAFKPEPLNPFYQRALFQEMRSRARQSLALLKERLPTLDASTRADAERVLSQEKEIEKAVGRVQQSTPALLAHSLSRRFSPWATALHRQRFLDHRLRRRAHALAQRPTPQAIARQGPGEHAPLVFLCLARGDRRQECHPRLRGDVRRRAAVAQRRESALFGRVSRRHRRYGAVAQGPERAGCLAGRLRVRQSAVRARLRVAKSPELGGDSAHRIARATWVRLVLDGQQKDDASKMMRLPA